MRTAIFLSFALLAPAIGASAQTMGSHNGPICPGPGPIYTRPAVACGAATLHAGLFNPGRFQLVYQSSPTGCIQSEYFLGCM